MEAMTDDANKERLQMSVIQHGHVIGLAVGTHCRIGEVDGVVIGSSDGNTQGNNVRWSCPVSAVGEWERGRVVYRSILEHRSSIVEPSLA